MTMTADTQLERPPVSWHTDPGPELTVVIPTKNERDNIAVLYRRLRATLQGLNWEVIFVDDDSDDGTPEIVRNLARQDRRVRLVHDWSGHIEGRAVPKFVTPAVPPFHHWPGSSRCKARAGSNRIRLRVSSS